MFERPRTGERAVLVRLGLGAPLDPEDLSEFTQLATSAGAIPVATITGTRQRPDPRFFVGSGKAEQIRLEAAACEADIILVDHPLSPSQERNLEKLTGKRVLDRNGLILDIFAQRARSHEGKLQVELAQLKHIASRLVRGWTHLERQRGGGIGLRGPGETQLETDRRLLGQRVKVLTQRLAKLQQQRETGRSARVAIPIPSIALVGVHQRGQVHAVSQSHRRAGIHRRPAVRNARSDGASPEAPRWDAGGGRRYRGASSATCRTNWWLRSSPRSPKPAKRRCCCMSSTPAIRGARSTWQRSTACSGRLVPMPSRASACSTRSTAWKKSHVSIAAKMEQRRLCGSAPPGGQGLELLGLAVAERLSRAVHRVRVQLPLTAGAARARLYAAGVVLHERSLDEALELEHALPDEELAALLRVTGAKLVPADGDTLESPGTEHRHSAGWR